MDLRGIWHKYVYTFGGRINRTATEGGWDTHQQTFRRTHSHIPQQQPPQQPTNNIRFAADFKVAHVVGDGNVVGLVECL